MIVLFVLNNRGELGPQQTTTMLARATRAAGHDVRVCGVGDIGVDERGVPFAMASSLPAADIELRDVAAAVRSTPIEYVAMPACGRVWLRTNPGRDPRRALHAAALDVARIAEERGVAVTNDPRGLREAASKLFLHQLPESVRPPTFVSGDPSALLDWARRQTGPFVLKPVVGTRGDGVFRFRSGSDDNVRQVVDWLTTNGVAMAQPFLPEAVHGDTRVVLLDGEPIRIDGHVAGVRRVPPEGDFRSNVHVGASPHPVDWSEDLARVAEAVAPRLIDLGIRLAGLDVIGDRVVEVNVFSTGGLFDAERYSGKDFCAEIVHRIVGPPVG